MSAWKQSWNAIEMDFFLNLLLSITWGSPDLSFAIVIPGHTKNKILVQNFCRSLKKREVESMPSYNAGTDLKTNYFFIFLFKPAFWKHVLTKKRRDQKKSSKL